jgi:PadR family transcriptional regulator PadR
VRPTLPEFRDRRRSSRPGTEKGRHDPHPDDESREDRKVRVERELMRGAGPVAVLGLLEQREMYGYELVEALSSQTDGVLAMGRPTLYPLLYNLERKQLIRGVWREAESGRKRKYYGVTQKGMAWLRVQQKQWGSLIGAMAGLGLIDVGSGRR